MTTKILCPNCDKQEGIVPCLGCKQVFCVKHFQVHRQKLFSELEDVVTRRNLLQEQFFNTITPTFEPTKLETWNTINDWEQNMKLQVARIADDVRKQLETYSKQACTQIEHNLNQMTTDIEQKLERENFVEDDIKNLTDQLDKIEDGFQNKKYHPRIELVVQPIDWNTLVQVKALIENNHPIANEKPNSSPSPPPVVLSGDASSKPKYPPSLQRKCFTCGTDTWQKECKCCNQTYCGWHLKRHALDSKKH